MLPMALSQRPGARFFAAFYRWSCHTQRASPCLHVAKRRLTGMPSLQDIRSYSSTTPCGQKEEGNPGIEVIDGTAEDIEEHGEPQRLEQNWREDEDVQQDAEAIVDDVQQQHVRTHALRSLMRRVPSSVVIITVASKDPKRTQRIPLGTALSSFNTVSLDPPYVSFNIKCPSQTLDAIRANGLFRVHFISDERKGAMIADAFTKGNNAEAFKQRHRVAKITPSKGKQAAKIRSPHVVAALECELTQDITVADHVIAIAKVRDLDKGGDADSTLLYHDGNYRRNNGTVLPIAPKYSDQGSAGSENIVSCWDYPLFPGESERKEFVNRLKQHILSNPWYLTMDTLQAVKAMTVTLRLPTSALGVEYSCLIDKCKMECGQTSSKPRSAQDHQILADFWGRLTPSDIASIVERAKKFVKSDPQVMNLHYQSFLGYLGIHSCSTGLLASDILEPLRAEGLVGSIDLSTKPTVLGFQSQARGLTLEAIEAIEIDLRNYLQTGLYDTMHRKTVKELVEAIGQTEDWVVKHINRVRPRIICDAFPELFSEKYIDIRGEVTDQEARVVVARVVHAMISDNPKAAYYKLKQLESDTLRRLGIHPMICGIDPDFLFGKLRHIAYNQSGLKKLLTAIDEMMSPLFSQATLGWEDVVSRARSLVQTHTLQVVKWPREDLLAAMGIDHRAKVKSPLSQNRPHLLHSHILPTIFAKELKMQHGKGSPTESAAISAYFQTNYRYSIQDKPPTTHTHAHTHTHTSRIAHDQSSSDPQATRQQTVPEYQSAESQGGVISEMRETVTHNLGFHALDGQAAKQAFEEAMREFGTLRRGPSEVRYVLYTGGRRRPHKRNVRKVLRKWEQVREKRE